MLNDTAVKEDKGWLKPLFEVVKTLLKALTPRLNRPVSYSPCATREMVFQHALSVRMGIPSVFQIRHQRSVAMDGGAEARTDGQREDTRVIFVPVTKPLFTHGHRIGIVEHVKPSVVKRLQGGSHVHLFPCLSDVWSGLSDVVHNSTRKANANGALPSQIVQSFADLWKNGRGMRGLGELNRVQLTHQFSGLEVKNPHAETAPSKVNTE